MTQRLNVFQHSPDLASALMKLAAGIKHTELGQQLLDLVNIRASQLNGCAFCVDMHVKEARIHGERDLRVHHVVVWRESPLFSERERAALEWTEAVTQLGAHGVSDEIFERVRAHFSDKDLSDLTYAIGVINFWNRLSIAFKNVPGSADREFGLTKAGLA